MLKKGILLVNTGTPERADPFFVGRYLKTFLSDPRVVDLPSVVRWILVNLLIVPFRAFKSAHAYQAVFLPEGSPLLIYSLALKTALSESLGEEYRVALGMRYSKPSIKAALSELKECDEITLLPLFPQYSSAATGSCLEECLSILSKENNVPPLRIIRDFYREPGFIQSYAKLITQQLAGKPVDFLLFSYHGLPERHLVKSGCRSKCYQKNQPCREYEANSFHCYRAQCYETSSLLAEAIPLSCEFGTTFQSRLGKTPWIQPYTDFYLDDLRKKGVENLAIACPSFVIDCLETLEEINLRARQQWESLGGKSFTFIPCLNTESEWVHSLAAQLKNPKNRV